MFCYFNFTCPFLCPCPCHHPFCRDFRQLLIPSLTQPAPASDRMDSCRPTDRSAPRSAEPEKSSPRRHSQCAARWLYCPLQIHRRCQRPVRGCSGFDIAVIQSTGHRVVSWRSRGTLKSPLTRTGLPRARFLRRATISAALLVRATSPR